VSPQRTHLPLLCLRPPPGLSSAACKLPSEFGLRRSSSNCRPRLRYPGRHFCLVTLNASRPCLLRAENLVLNPPHRQSSASSQNPSASTVGSSHGSSSLVSVCIYRSLPRSSSAVFILPSSDHSRRRLLFRSVGEGHVARSIF
jgi:hypothetical protein